jgi:hypothetical protein
MEILKQDIKSLVYKITSVLQGTKLKRLLDLIPLAKQLP